MYSCHTSHASRNMYTCMNRCFAMFRQRHESRCDYCCMMHTKSDLIYVTPGCGRSRRSPDLEVSIAPGRRAEILIAVTAGGYCLTRVCSRSRPHLNSIFAGKLHARDPLHWVICIRRIRWHGAHLQAVVIVMEILLPDPEKLPSSLWLRNLRVLSELKSSHVIAYAGDLNFYHSILCFFAVKKKLTSV